MNANILGSRNLFVPSDFREEGYHEYNSLGKKGYINSGNAEPLFWHLKRGLDISVFESKLDFPGDIILSSELLFYYPSFTCQIATLLARLGFRTEIIAYVGAHNQMAVKAYCQQIRNHRFHGGFVEFLANPEPERLLYYSEIYHELVACPDIGDVILRPFHSPLLRNGDIVDDFFWLVDRELDSSILRRPEHYVNVTPTLAEIEALRIVNRSGAEEPIRRLLSRQSTVDLAERDRIRGYFMTEKARDLMHRRWAADRDAFCLVMPTETWPLWQFEQEVCSPPTVLDHAAVDALVTWATAAPSDPPKTAFFTISSWNYLHYARALASSLAVHHPGIDRVIAIADSRREDLTGDDFPEFDDSIFFDDLDLPERRAFSFRYDVMELNTAIKPTVFRRLFAQGYDRVIYLDPDIIAYRRFDELFDALDRGASAVLTPHALAPNLQPDSPNDLTFMQAGVYNLGFMALANTPQTLQLLKWWETRLRTECVSHRVADGLFVDQKFVDLWPAYGSETHILRNPAYNVAYWNLDTRSIEQRGEAYAVDGVPLAFFHFSGVVPGDRSVLSKHQRRWRPDSTPELQRLFDDYHARLETFGLRKFAEIPYGFGTFTDGTGIPNAARRLFRERLEPFSGDPFADLPAYLNQPADLVPNAGGAITRFMHALWELRPDLQAYFDLRGSESQLSYADWFVRDGAVDARIPAAFVQPVSERLSDLGAQARTRTSHSTLTAGVARLGYRVLMKAQPRIKWLYRRIPPAARKRVLEALFRRAWPAAFGGGSVPLGQGVSLIGYPFAEMGVGEAMRSLARSIESVEVAYEVVNFDEQVRSSQKDRTLQNRLTDTPSKSVNVFCVNADMLMSTIRGVGTSVLHNRYNIIRPFWELPRIHPQWLDGLKHVDEIWAPTTFVGDAFIAGIDRQVINIPVSVSVPSDMRPDRDRFGIPNDATAFLFAFDFSSYPARKNPGAVLEAYLRAFGADRKRNVSLVIKTMGQSAQRDDILASIRRLAQDDDRIVLIDRVLTRAEMYGLTASCDVFVSLHRSEGFGLGIAEAMAFGKAVIATDFSGSRDFVSDKTGFPVPYRLIDVEPDQYPYFVGGQQWADPDIDEAARIMTSLADNRDMAIAVGGAAKTFMETFHSPQAVGRIIDTRLRQIYGHRNALMTR
jgi:glycosyltransferase involved in cell wall biosynthesis